jgi:hypothetical protein
MNDFDRACAVCADEGVNAALRTLPSGADLMALAEACRRHAERVQRQGDQIRADRLLSAVQYLAYLEMSYEMD